MNTRGVELSFNMIISIIIIAAILATAFYSISYFLDLKKCTDTGLFWRDLEQTVEKAWNSERVQQTFKGTLPGTIDSVCIGDVQRAQSSAEYELLEEFALDDANVYLYEPRKACEGNAAKSLPHLALAQQNLALKCFPVQNGIVEIRLTKQGGDSLVRAA